MPEYTAYYSNSLKKLAMLCSEKTGSCDLFGRQTIVIVQNRNMEEWLKLELASASGISAGIRFMFQDQAVRKILGCFPGAAVREDGKSIVYLDDLKIIIYRQLESIFGKIENFPDFRNLKRYIDESSDSGDREFMQIRSERLFSLSDSIAGLFYHYGLNCNEMTGSWEKEKSFLENTAYAYNLAHEKWQMQLWNIIFSPSSPCIHLGQIIGEVTAGKYRACAEVPDVVIFGSSFISEQSVSFFHYLSENCGSSVSHFILSPSPLIGKDAGASRGGGENDNGASALFDKWSGIVRGLSSLLAGKKVRAVESYEAPDTDTLLGAFKNCVYENREPSLPPALKSGPDNTVLSGDDSVRIVSCSGRKREIQILKDHILRLVSEKGYKFHEIGVAAPDINCYVPFIESLFPSGETVYDVPYNIMDIGYAVNSGFVKAFMDLVSLCGSRFTRKELFGVFSSQCFMERFSLSPVDVGKWLDACGDLSVKWGVDLDHRKEAVSYDDNAGTWGLAAERYAAGILFDSSEGAVSLPGKLLLPYESEDESLALMFTVARSLYRDLYSVKKYSMKLHEWTAYFESVMDRYLRPVPGTGQDRDRYFIKDMFRQINNLAAGNPAGQEEKNSSGHGGKTPAGHDGESTTGKTPGNSGVSVSAAGEGIFPYSVFRALLEEYSQSVGYCRGQYLSSGVCFSSLKPLRAIPFRAIFLLGMDIDVFPGKEKPLSYDLRNVTEKSIDLSKQNTDCFAFLETVVSAGEMLVLSHNGINPVTGEECGPSTVASDLEDMLRRAGSGKISIRHPMFPYDPVYYPGKGAGSSARPFISYDKNNFLPAAVIASGGKTGPSYPLFSVASGGKGIAGPGESYASASENAAISDIAFFLRSPVACHLRKKLDIRISATYLAENDVDESMDIDFFEYLDSVRELAGLEESVDFDAFFSIIAERKMLEGGYSSSSAALLEQGFYRAAMEGLYDNLASEKYFSAEQVSFSLGMPDEKGKRRGEKTVVLPALELGLSEGKLGICGRIRGLRTAVDSGGRKRISAVMNGSVSYRNAALHFLNYLVLKESLGHEIAEYTLYDIKGEKRVVFSGETCPDSGKSIAAAAKAYVSNLHKPFVVDSQAIDAALTAYKRGGGTKDALDAIRRHYSVNVFADMKFLECYTRVMPAYDNPEFAELLEGFYYYLTFI